jgi:hypothetical protein
MSERRASGVERTNEKCAPVRIHRSTAIALMLVSALLLWANLRPDGWKRITDEYGFRTDNPNEQLESTNLDPLTKSLFYRGWPLSPFLFCSGGLTRWHPDQSPLVGLVGHHY